MRCMNHKYGELIKGTVGKVMDVEVETDDMRWGRFLRVRMEVNLAKPLARGRSVENEKFWILLKYEKLPVSVLCAI